jgi:beta-aspartyl-peptidase (threonine type)
MAVHGGAGVIKKEQMPPGAEEAYLEKLREALAKGYGILKAGGPCLDAVETTIRVLEDFPLFNAGKGSAFTHDGRNQMDAAIMNGADLRAGAVAGVSRVRNPIRAARAVMERSHHVMLTGEGAESFAGQAGLAMEEPSYFYTEARWRQLQDALAAERSGDPGALRLGGSPTEEKFGTVGCVALDLGGNLAAGTSTGGMVNKSFNRVGDSPIIGAGTYANNRTCAVSCTGWGEFFIRTLAAKTVSDLMEYKGISLREATDLVIFSIIPELGGDGGMIAVDRAGQVAMPFNTPGMFRGQVDGRGEVTVEMYGS